MEKLGGLTRKAMRAVAIALFAAGLIGAAGIVGVHADPLQPVGTRSGPAIHCGVRGDAGRQCRHNNDPNFYSGVRFGGALLYDGAPLRYGLYPYYSRECVRDYGVWTPWGWRHTPVWVCF